MAPAPPVDILVVDDDDNNLRALEAVLASGPAPAGSGAGLSPGLRLVLARSGPEALRHLLHRDFALIILDIQMPEMDGFETAAYVRQRERTRHIPIIFLTAFQGSAEQIARGYSLGAVDFLFKPIVAEVLRTKVSVFVELARKTDEVKRQAALLLEAQRREQERLLEDERQRWAAQRLRAEMEKERRAAETLARVNARLRLLADAASGLLLQRDPRPTLGRLLSDLAGHLGLEIHFHCQLGSQAGELGECSTLVMASAAGLTEDETRTFEGMLRWGSLCGRSVRERIVLEEIQGQGLAATGSLRLIGLTALASEPLMAEGKLLGVLVVGTRRRPRLEPEELSVVRLVADQMAMALDRAHLIDELRARANELAEADQRKNEFLAMLAHELRNPLTPVLNAVELMRHQEGEAPGTQRSREVIDRQIRHMARLVDDLLDMARITNGKIELRRERVSLHAVVEHAMQTSAPLVREREHALEVSLPATPVDLVVDPTRLSQIVANLLNNAAKYTAPGGRIWLVADVDGEEVVIRVRDTGRGIPSAMLPRIFELFVQTRSMDQTQGGLGIGLTLVRRLLELHGGTIAASSAGEGQGTEFLVRLPRVTGPVDEAEPPAPTLARPEPDLASGSSEPSSPAVAPGCAPAESRVGEGPPRLTVVVVEDNPDIRDTLKDLLTLFGHDVEVAEDGERGVEKVLALRPRVALVDIGMPGLDGYGVARCLREKVGKSLKLIAMTGFGQPEDQRKALEAGFDAHLVKPVDPNVLSRLLTES